MSDSTSRFQTLLTDALAKLVPGDETQAAATIALDKHREELRDIATLPQNMKVRTMRVAAADDALLESLEQLSDTEHDDQEQPGPAAAEKPTAATAAAEKPAAEPEPLKGKSTRKKPH